VTLVRRDGRYFIGGIVRPARGAPPDGVRIEDELLAVDGLNIRQAGKGAVLAALRGQPGQTRTLTLLGPGGENKIEAPALDLS
jgi:C-terminal processing protease CtpA/Prc